MWEAFRNPPILGQLWDGAAPRVYGSLCPAPLMQGNSNTGIWCPTSHRFPSSPHICPQVRCGVRPILSWQQWALSPCGKVIRRERTIMCHQDGVVHTPPQRCIAQTCSSEKRVEGELIQTENLRFSSQKMEGMGWAEEGDTKKKASNYQGSIICAPK